MQPDNYLGMGYGRSTSSMIRRSIVPPYCATGSAQSCAHREKMFEEWAASRNMYTRGMADDADGLAREYADANMTIYEIYGAVRTRIYTAVLAHEVGHSIGLMHNFGASDDALNYFPEYWEIRSQDGTWSSRGRQRRRDHRL